MAVVSQRLCLLSVFLMLGSVTRANTPGPDKNTTVNQVKIENEYRSPQLSSIGVYFMEHFDDEEAFRQRWVQSKTKKQTVDENKYEGKWEIQTPLREILKNDLGLVLVSEGKHAAISALLDKPFEFRDKPLIVQYEVTFQEGQRCGGAYIKLLSQGAKTRSELRKFFDQYPYTIMFGPDKCGNSKDLHFIFRHKNPKDITIEKKYTKKLSWGLDDFYNDKEPHLYTLIVRPDHTYTILIDYKVIINDSLPEDFTSSVNVSGETDEPNVTEPDDWDESVKGVGNGLLTRKPNCSKDNRFFEMEPIYAVGFGLWSMSPLLLFDNVLVTDDPAVAQQWADQTFALKRAKISNGSISNAETKNAYVTVHDHCHKSETEAEDKESDKGKNKSNKEDFENLEMELIHTNVSLLELGQKYAGIFVGSFILAGLFTYIIWCGPKSSLDAEIKNTDAKGAGDSHQSEADAKAKGDLHQSEVYVKAESDSHQSEVDAKRHSEVEADRDGKQEVECNTENEPIITSKEKLKNSDPERINNHDESLLEHEQKNSGGNPWLYAGVIIGSFISVGIVTYHVWSGRKSDSVMEINETDDVAVHASRVPFKIRR